MSLLVSWLEVCSDGSRAKRTRSFNDSSKLSALASCTSPVQLISTLNIQWLMTTANHVIGTRDLNSILPWRQHKINRTAQLWEISFITTLTLHYIAGNSLFCSERGQNMCNKCYKMQFENWSDTIALIEFSWVVFNVSAWHIIGHFGDYLPSQSLY